MEALVWNIGIQGCLQPIAALFVALVLCPVISFVILTSKWRNIVVRNNVLYSFQSTRVLVDVSDFLSLSVAVIRYWVRVLWDTAMFHLVIKNRGRIPASDSFVVKRIAGPGLASDYYYQVFASHLYKEELDEISFFGEIKSEIKLISL
jgi:hypothetical protein